MTEALEFLRALRPGGPWQLVAIQPDRIGPGRVRGCRAVTVKDARQFISANSTRNLYYHVNSCREDMVGVKAKKRDIARVEFVHADLDPSEGESPADAKERYRAGLKASGLPAPNFLVDSGGGLQALWRIEPIDGPAPTVVSRIEAISKAIMGLLGSAAGTQDVSRILRLPNTTNWPDELKRARGRVPVMARLLSSCDGVHSLDCFPQSETTGVPEVGLGEVDPTAHDWRAVVDKYRRRLRPRHVALMTTEVMRSGPNKRSEMIFMIVAELYDAGADWDEIAAVLWRSPYFISKQTQSIDRLEAELTRIKDYLARQGRKQKILLRPNNKDDRNDLPV
jgi:hypothetical protein